MRPRAVLFGVGLFCAACAASPRPETRSAARINESAPEKIAAQRAASRNLQLEADDERWGMEAARARRQDKNRAAQSAQSAAPAPTGPVDLQRPAPASAPSDAPATPPQKGR